MPRRVDEAIEAVKKTDRQPARIDLGTEIYDELRLENTPPAAIMSHGQDAPFYMDADLPEVTKHQGIPVVERYDVPGDSIGMEPAR